MANYSLNQLVAGAEQTSTKQKTTSRQCNRLTSQTLHHSTPDGVHSPALSNRSPNHTHPDIAPPPLPAPPLGTPYERQYAAGDAAGHPGSWPHLEPHSDRLVTAGGTCGRRRQRCVSIQQEIGIRA